MIGRKADELNFEFAGLNHFHFHRVFDANTGENVTHQIAYKMMEDDKSNMQNIQNEKFLLDQLLSMDCLPCGYHRYYYLTAEMRKKELEDYAKHETRAESVKQIENQLFELYKDPALHEMPELLGKRGGKYYSDAACETISAIYNNSGKVMVVSTENKGALPDLPADAIVEAAKDGPFLSKDDFRQRTKVSKTIIDLMDSLGLLGDLPESNQISIFDLV